MEVAAFQPNLADCRFCPMCKPAAEVASVRRIESYSTRSRAMMLWRIAAGHRTWTPRSAELLYQSTLDSISEAFCVSDRPVSGYILAARQDVWAAGLAPAAVQEAVARLASVSFSTSGDGQRVLVAGECAESDQGELAMAVAEALRLRLVLAPTGSTAYALGARDLARQQATAVASAIAGASLVVADGPQTHWSLARIWPTLNVELGAEVASLPGFVVADPDLVRPRDLGAYHAIDSRASALLADSLARPVAIGPGHFGEPDDAGSGAIYDDLRQLLTLMGGQEQRHRWERSLARSTGADDGLWATYPDLADDLARASMDAAVAAGATTVVSDSALATWQLRRVGSDGPAISWIGELVGAV